MILHRSPVSTMVLIGLLALPTIARGQGEPARDPSRQPAPSSPAGDPSPAPAVPPSSRAQIDLSSSAGYTTFSPPLGSPIHEDSLSGLGGFALTFYPSSPLIDTDAPLTLQPILERLTTLKLAASGGGFDTRAARLGGPLAAERQGTSISTSFGADAYVTQSFIASASLGFAHFTTTDIGFATATAALRTSSQVPVSLGIGGRFSDARINVGWNVVPTSADGTWKVPFWSGVSASLTTVFAREVELYVSASGINRGASASAFVGVYPLRQFGIFASIFAESGQLYLDSLAIFSGSGGSLGFSGWLSRHFGGSLTYAPTWLSGSTPTVSHLFTLHLYSRIQ